MQGAHNLDFLRRINPRIDAHMFNHRLKLGEVKPGQLGAGHYPVVTIHQYAELSGDCTCRGRMIPGNHHRGDADGFAQGNGFPGFATRRVDQADKAEED